MMAPTTVTEAAPTMFSCALCNKTYERRDLRERHRRRCEKSINKIRPSKKKSCDLCVQAKLKCDLQQPACSRCTRRRVLCKYPNDPSGGQLPDSAVSLPANGSASYAQDGVDTGMANDDPMGIIEDSGYQSSLSSGGGNAGLYAQRHTASIAEHHTYPINTSVPSDIGLNNAPITTEPDILMDTGVWDTSSFQMPSLYAGMQADGYFTPGTEDNSPFDIPGSGDYFNVNANDMLTGNHAINTRSLELLRLQQMTREGQQSIHADSPSDPFVPYSINDHSSLADRPSHTSSTSIHTLSDDIRPPSPKHLAIDRSRTQSVSDQERSPRSRPSPSIRQITFRNTYDDSASDDSSREGSPAGTTNPLWGSQRRTIYEADNNSAFSAEDIAAVLCEYPKKMLNRAFWSPFVHHTYYRCSKGGMAEPLAIALCCVSANKHSVDTSTSFVCKMINDQRERLVSEFPKKTLDLVEICASLHALCIYQIESMLAFRVRRSAGERLSAAELHHNFFLKMTRCIMRKQSDLLLTLDNESLTWESWTISETLRRTIFLVNMINNLSFLTNALNPHYYEPLHENFILKMPLPAPEEMWKALDSEQWAAAKKSSGWTRQGVITLEMALQKLQSEEELGEFQSLQRLVVSCARLKTK